MVYGATVKPALVATSTLRSASHCDQLGKVLKFEPIVAILYCSSIAVTCVMRNVVTLLHPKRTIARYNALPITATECARAFNIIESAKMNIQK